MARKTVQTGTTDDGSVVTQGDTTVADETMIDTTNNANDDGDVSIDLTMVKPPEPFDNQFHSAVIAGCKRTISANKNTVFTLQWRIDEGDEKFAGRSVYDPLTISENTMWKVKRFLVCIGLPEDFRGGINPQMLIGERADIRVDMEPQTRTNVETGEPYPPRPRVRTYAPYGSQKSLESVIS